MTGVLQLPIFGGIKQSKFIVILKDCPLIVHRLGWKYNDPMDDFFSLDFVSSLLPRNVTKSWGHLGFRRISSSQPTLWKLEFSLFFVFMLLLWWEGQGKTLTALTASDFCLKVFFFPSQGFFKKDIFSKVGESWEGNRVVLDFFACCVLCSFFRTWERFLEPPKNHSIVSDQEAMRFLIGIIDRWKSLRYLKLTLVQDARCLSTMSFHASTLRCGHHPTKSGFIGQMAKLGLLVSLLLVAAWCQGWERW